MHAIQANQGEQVQQTKTGGRYKKIKTICSGTQTEGERATKERKRDADCMVLEDGKLAKKVKPNGEAEEESENSNMVAGLNEQPGADQ